MRYESVRIARGEVTTALLTLGIVALLVLV